MASNRKNSIRLFAGLVAGIVLAMSISSFNRSSSSPPLEVWHTEKLNEEFTAELLNDGVSNFNEYKEFYI